MSYNIKREGSVQYHDYSNSKVLAVDIETYDPDLKDLGPGYFRPEGYILGVSLCDEAGRSEYFNLGHYDCSKEEREKNIEYLKEQLNLPMPKIGARITYDLGWLMFGAGVYVRPRYIDIQNADALIDENQGKYSLEFLSHKYLNIGKQSTAPEQFCKENGLSGDFRKWLYKMPYWMVRDYAISDVEHPIRIYEKQLPILEREELTEVFEMECKLLEVLLLIKKTGVLIDQDKRDRNGLILQNRIEEARLKLFSKYGEFNYNSSQQLAKIFDKEGIAYPSTDKGNPSIGSDFLKSNKDAHPFLGDLFDLRRADKILNTFIMGAFDRFVTSDGLIHCDFYNTRNDEYGTRSGRLSSANPNLQQVPSPGVDTYYGQLCREIFIPFPGCDFGKLDYSQIEYRFMAHFARGEGSDEVRSKYNTDPDTDYHQYIMDLTGLKRRFAKNLNFGVAYGMGAKKMSTFFGWGMAQCYDILDTYHTHAPFIKSTIDVVENISKRRGYIKTFLGRRSRLINKDKAYTMFCRLIQGSAADIMKQAMVKIYEDGIFNTIYPHLTVHDELDVSIPRTREGYEALKAMQKRMENCIDIRVPIKADVEIGPNWGYVEEVEDIDERIKELGL